MFFAHISNWKRPWWQPKWLRHMIRHRLSDDSQVQLALTRLDQLRTLFGMFLSFVLFFQLHTFSILTISTLQSYFNWPLWFVQFLNQYLSLLLFIMWGLLSVTVLIYNWIRHFKIKTKWTWSDVFGESLIVPIIFGAIGVILILCFAGLWANIMISPIISTVIACALAWLIIQYLFSVCTWQLYLLQHLKTHPGFKDGMI